MFFHTVLFELAGVLAEVAPLRVAALRAGLAGEGVTIDDATARALDATLPSRAGVAAAAAAAGVALDETGLDLAALRADRELAALVAQGVVLVPGAREALVRLASWQRLAVVTRLPREVAATILRVAELEPVVEVVVAAEDVREGPPSPAGHLAALDRLARRRPVDPARTLALADGATGIAAAAAAGLTCIAVGAVPAHAAVAAAGLLPSLDGATPQSLAAVAGLTLEAGR